MSARVCMYVWCRYIIFITCFYHWTALALVGFPALNNVYIAVLRIFRVMPINYSHIRAQIQREKHKRNIDFTFGLLVRRSTQKPSPNCIMWLKVARLLFSFHLALVYGHGQGTSTLSTNQNDCNNSMFFFALMCFERVLSGGFCLRTFYVSVIRYCWMQCTKHCSVYKVLKLWSLYNFNQWWFVCLLACLLVGFRFITISQQNVYRPLSSLDFYPDTLPLSHHEPKLRLSASTWKNSKSLKP